LQPSSPLPGPSPYAGPTRGLTERREPESLPVSPESRPASPESHSASPVRTVCAGRRVSRPRPPPVPGTHSMTQCPSTAPQHVPLPSPPASSLPDGPDPASDSLRAARPAVTRFLATAVTDPLFESTAASALVAELVEFAAACRLDYATSLIAESASASVCPPSVGGACALGTDVLEDRQEEFECFAAAVPHLVSMLIAPEGDPDAPDILTPRSYAEAIEGTYVDEVPPPGANIVSGMWIFRGNDFFQTFSPTPKMTTLRVLLHVAAQRDYELHSLDFSTAFLQGSLHEEIWLRRPPRFTGLFPAGTLWSLRRPVYGLRQAPREWHDTLRTTLAALGFAPSIADPSLFLRTDTTLPPLYVLVYVDDWVFATADTEALAHVKSELQKRHTCTDLGELTSYLSLRITRDRAQRTITLTQSHMVQQVLQRFGFTYSSPQSTPLPTGHSIWAPPSDESVELSGPYPELVGCLMFLMTCTRPDLAYALSLLARYVAPSRHQKVHWDAVKRVLLYLCSTSGMGLVLGGRARVVLTSHANASWVDDLATQRSSQAPVVRLRSTLGPWLHRSYGGSPTYLGEAPRSPLVLYVDNKAMLALCQEHRLEHRTKHIALRYFLARELQQRGQLRLAYVASQANTADVFTKALQHCDHQPCFAFLDWSCDLLFSPNLPMGDLVELDDSGPKAWKLMRDVIQPNTVAMVIVLEKELAALSMRPGDDMQQCTKIISVLDNSWDNLIPTLNTQQDQWTPEWLRHQILQEDFRRRHTGGGAANKTAEGYGAAGGSRGRGGGRGRGRGRGFGRGRGRGDYNEGHGSSGGRGSTRMEGACWSCEKVGHPWFKCFNRPEGWAPPGMKPPSGERARGGAVQGSGAQGDGAHGKADPGMFLMVEDVKGSEGDVGSVGKVLMHPLTHWVIDSSCTSHMTPRADLLDEVKPPGKIKFVAAVSGALLPVIGVGNAKEEKSNCIKDLWQLPIIPWNGKLSATAAEAATAKATAGAEETAPSDGVLDAVKKVQQPQQPHGQVLAGVDATAAWAKASSGSGEADWETWHERLCHVNFPKLQKLVKDGSLKGLDVKGAVKEIGSCPTCLETMFTKFLFSSGTGPAKAPLALVHMDVVGPTKAPSLSGSRYFLTIEWMPRAERESGHKVKVIRTDNGGEFIGADFEAVLKKKGIQHQLTVPYNPQQNGVAERFNQTLQEGARTLLGRAGLPDPFWVTALRQVALVKNRVLATVGDK
ncbi:unnamed protein product, partial [Closterium sp. NIES-53]